jgi:hypothetical protein
MTSCPGRDQVLTRLWPLAPAAWETEGPAAGTAPDKLGVKKGLTFANGGTVCGRVGA